MGVYLPIAEMNVDVSLLFGLGAIVGYLAGLLGITGGFLVTPILIFIGIPPPVAVASQANQLIASSISGSISFARHGKVDYRLAFVLLIGGIMGSICGVYIFTLLKYYGHIDLVIKISYIVLLTSMGLMIFIESIKSLLHLKKKRSSRILKERFKWFRNLPLKIKFTRSKLEISLLAPLMIGFVVGVLLSILGIGTIVMIPAMIYLLRMPGSMVPGTSLFQIIFVACSVTLLHAVTNHSVDIILALTLLLGSVIGAPLGSRMSQKLPPEYLRFFLALLLLGMSSKLIFDAFSTPKDLYTIEVLYD
jgi:uncharacterized protein